MTTSGKSDLATTASETMRYLEEVKMAERGLLACMLLSPTEVIPEIVTRVDKSWFASDLRHAALYQLLRDMHFAGKPIDVATVVTEATAKKMIKQIGGVDYVAGLPDASPSAANYQYFLEILEGSVYRRSIATICTSFLSRVNNGKLPHEALLSELEKEILSIREKVQSGKTPFANLAEVREQLDWMYALSRSGAGIPGAKSGYQSLDNLTGVWREGDYFIIAARPSVGKTSLALSVLARTVIRGPYRAGFFSLEMSAQSVIHRMACVLAKVDTMAWERNLLLDEEWNRLSDAHAEIIKAESKLAICDEGGLTMQRLAALARQMKQRINADFFVIDYLQLIIPNRKDSTRYEAVTEISMGLKNLAKELRVPLLVLAQLNRASERDNRPPRMSDLRDSGNLEADADRIGLLYEDESAQNNGSKQIVLNLCKNRNGPTGLIRLMFVPKQTAFYEIAPQSDLD